MALAFDFSPTTCNNTVKPSRVQALEFSASKWTGTTRAEIATQYRVVGPGAPPWLIWNGSGWVPLDLHARCLEANHWHRLILTGRILNGSERYEALNIDGQNLTVTRTFPQVPSASPPRLTVAVQADGNRTSSPYGFWIDRVHLAAQ